MAEVNVEREVPTLEGVLVCSSRSPSSSPGNITRKGTIQRSGTMRSIEGGSVMTGASGFFHSASEVDLDVPSNQRSLVFMEEEKTSHQDHCGSRFVLYSSSPFRSIWGLLVTVMLVYTGTLFIFRLCFWDCRIAPTGDVPVPIPDYQDLWNLLDNGIYVLFVVDLFVTFFFSYTDEYGVEVDSLRHIAGHYLKTTFLINLLACVPDSLVQMLVAELYAVEDAPSDLNQMVRVVRLQRMSRLFRLFRLTRFAKMKACGGNKLFQWVQSCKGVRVVNLCVALAWIVHLLACLWYLCAALQSDPENTWVARRQIDTNGEASLRDSSTLDQWLHSMYFVLTVFTTVGFGDISAFTTGEIVGASIIMVTGAVVHSIIISEVISVVTANDSTNIFVQQKSDLVQAFSQHTELAPEARQELQSWIGVSARLWVTNHYDREEMKSLITGKYMPRSLLGRLPEALYNGRLVRNQLFSIYSIAGGVPPRLPMLVALAIHRTQFELDELIYQVNDFPFNLFLVISGTFAYAAKPTSSGGVPQVQLAVSKEAQASTAATPSAWASAGKYVKGTRTIKSYVGEESSQLFPYQLFPTGTYFGDVELFSGQPRRATARCETEGGVVLSLHKNDLAKLSEEFPQFGNAWRSASIRRRRVQQRREQQLTRGMTHRHLAATTIQSFVRKRQEEGMVDSPSSRIADVAERGQTLRPSKSRGRNGSLETSRSRRHALQDGGEVQELREDMAALRGDVGRILEMLSARNASAAI